MDLPAPDGPAPLSPAHPAPGSPPLAYKDRSTALLVFGILEIAGGVISALMLPVMLIGMVIARKAQGGGAPLKSMLPSTLTFAILAVVLVTLGIGAIQARRWARALNLVVSWLWLIIGAFATIAILMVLPGGFLAGMKAAEKNPNAPPITPAAMAVVLTVIIVFLAVLLVVMPLVFLLFYRSKDVIDTCRHRDPVERWTDRIPLPVLAVVLIAGIGTISNLVASFSTPLLPMFGKYLVGPPASLGLLLLAAVDLFVAIALFRLNIAGWWVAVVSILIRLVSTAITYARSDMLEAYARLGRSSEELNSMRNNPAMRSGAYLWLGFASTLLYFGYLLWVKRYFPAPDPPRYTGMSEPISPSSPPGS